MVGRHVSGAGFGPDPLTRQVRSVKGFFIRLLLKDLSQFNPLKSELESGRNCYTPTWPEQ